MHIQHKAVVGSRAATSCSVGTRGFGTGCTVGTRGFGRGCTGDVATSVSSMRGCLLGPFSLAVVGDITSGCSWLLGLFVVAGAVVGLFVVAAGGARVAPDTCKSSHWEGVGEWSGGGEAQVQPLGGCWRVEWWRGGNQVERDSSWHGAPGHLQPCLIPCL